MDSLVLNDVHQANAIAVAIKDIFNIKLTRARERSANAFGFNSHNHLVSSLKESMIFHDPDVYIRKLDESLRQHHQINMSDEQVGALKNTLSEYEDEVLFEFYNYAIVAVNNYDNFAKKYSLQDWPQADIGNIETVDFINPNIEGYNTFDDAKRCLKRFCEDGLPFIIEEEQEDVCTGIRAYCSPVDLGEFIQLTINGERTHFIAIRFEKQETIISKHLDDQEVETCNNYLQVFCENSLYGNTAQGFWHELLKTPDIIIPVTLSRRDKLSLFDIDNWLWDEEYGDPSPEYNYGSDYELLTIRTKQSHQKESCISLYTPSMDALYASDDYFDVEFAEELTSAIRNTYNLIKEVTQNYPSLNMTPGASLAELNDLSKGEVCRLCYLSKLRTETLPISIDYDQDPTVFGDRFVSLLRDAKVTQVVANTWLQPSSGYAMVYACNAFDSDGKSHYRFELFCGFRHAMGKGHPVFETLKKAGITFSIQHEYEYSASASYVEFEINDDYTSYYAFKSPDNNHVPCQVMFAVYHADTTTRIPPFHASDITPDNDFLRELISFPPYRNGHVLSSIMANVNMESWGGIAKELVKKHNSKDGVNLPVFHRELSMRLDPGPGELFLWVTPILINVTNDVFSYIENDLYGGPRDGAILGQLTQASGLSDVKDFRFTDGEKHEEVYSERDMERLANAFLGKP